MCNTGTVTLHRVLRAPAERVYRAFLDPDAMAKWLPPHGFTGKVHEMDAKVGGGYRMSFTNFGTGNSHSFGGTYLELAPHETHALHRPLRRSRTCPARCRCTVTLKPVDCGTELHDRAGRHSRGDSGRVLLPRLAGIADPAGAAGRAEHPRQPLILPAVPRFFRTRSRVRHDPRPADPHPRHLHARRHQQGRVLPPGRPARRGAGPGPGARCAADARDRLARPLRQAHRWHGRGDLEHQQVRDHREVGRARPRRRLPVRAGVHRHRLRRLERQLRQPVVRRGAVRDRQRPDRSGPRAARRHRHRAHLAGQHRQDHRRARAD